METTRWDHPQTPEKRKTSLPSERFPLEYAPRVRPRRRRRPIWRYDTDRERCPLCGLDGPSYRVETSDHVPLGCERCLLVYRDGVVQL